MEVKPMHPALEPLKFLLGKWKSIEASGKFPPRVGDFSYCEELEFVSVGQPMLNYKSTSWHPVQKVPMHQECGFLKIKPGTNEIAFMVAHNFGLTTIEEGNVIDGSVKLKSTKINRSTFNKDPEVTEIQRNLSLKNDGQLELKVFMATSLSPIPALHLDAVYEKCV